MLKNYTQLIIFFKLYSGLPQNNLINCTPAEQQKCLKIFGNTMIQTVDECKECDKCENCPQLPDLLDILGEDDADVIELSLHCSPTGHCSKGKDICKSNCVSNFDVCKKCFRPSRL